MARHCIRLGLSGIALCFALAGTVFAQTDGPMVASYNQGGPVNSSNDDNLEYRPPSELWYGGLEATFMHVVRQGAPSVEINAVESFVDEIDPSSNNADSQYGVAPRFWLGLQLNDCWGVRGRFWQLKDNNSALSGDPGYSFDGDNGPGGDFSVASYSLDAYNIDLEATRNWCSGEWSGDMSLGACYASLQRDEFASLYFLDTGTTAFGSAHRRMGGAGVTSSFEAHHCLGDRGWKLFGNLRGSVLFGTTTGVATAAASLAAEGDATSDGEGSTGNTTIYIFESQIGTEWSHPLTCMRGTFFFRGACEYQWWCAEHATASVAVANINDVDGTVNVTSTTPSASIGFIGITASAGFRF
jgi:hypothetical protein